MTEFKAGDKVRIIASRTLDECGQFELVGDSWRVPEVEAHYGITVEPEPVPYTDPHDGDEVEVRLTMTVRTRHRGAYGDETDLNGAEFDRLCEAGRVSLVKAAAPQYILGRIYRDGDGALWVHVGGGYPWQRLTTDGHWIHAKQDAPADLVLCDVVPAQVSP